ncbi:MAG: beta-ketoacyl-[acyl-carrier-protein] synthase family protein [Bacillaceae bacterium]|nr:beta-ketoacyl-[acyl-carrier-protein] synthase family protein [Bacillaceae bacterium]
MHKEDRVVVTGFEMITPFGNTNSTWEALIQGKSSVGVKKDNDLSNMKSRVVSELDRELLETSPYKRKIRSIDPIHNLALIASSAAIKMAGVDQHLFDKENTGVVMGSLMGSTTSSSKASVLYERNQYNQISPSLGIQITGNALSAQIAIEHKLMGPNLTINTACSTGGQAVVLGSNLIRTGFANTMVVGGVDLITDLGIYKAYDNLRVMIEDENDLPRPFSKDRNGFAMGEGIGVLILESLSHAEERGAKIYGEILGTASTCDAFTMAIPVESGEVVARTMSEAIERSGIGIDAIDYISAHATGTNIGDITETNAIKKVFGDRAYDIPVSSLKGSIGHTLAAAGSIDIIACILSINNMIIPPTTNYIDRDEKCDLNYVPNEASRKRIKTCISNSFGFGGNNTSVVIREFTN